MTEKSNRNPEYLSRESCGAGNLTFLWHSCQKKCLEQQTRDAQKNKREVEQALEESHPKAVAGV